MLLPSKVLCAATTVPYFVLFPGFSEKANFIVMPPICFNRIAYLCVVRLLLAYRNDKALSTTGPYTPKAPSEDGA
jgi:hypothetical protein